MHPHMLLQVSIFGLHMSMIVNKRDLGSLEQPMVLHSLVARPLDCV